MNNFDTIVKGIIDELEDIPEDATVEYEVWAIGYNGDEVVTDTDFLLKTFTDPDDAVKFAKECTLADVINMSAEDSYEREFESEVAYISIEVETVVEDEDEGTMNVGTIYHKTIDISPVDIELAENDYELLEDGSLRISCKLLKDFNKNDFIKVMFANENDTSILTYKIISKTTANDYVCELFI
jgi:hypothetical protein